MFLRIFLLLLVAFNKLSSSENCETIDWLQPFNNSSNFHCFSNGWYPDETDEDCRRYFVCVKNSENFLQLYLTCPNGTYFNKYTISCTEDYVCPYKLTTTTQKVTSNTDMSNSCLYESDSDYFDCHESGSFPNYNDLTCTSYFYCINIISPNLTLKTKYFCSNNTYFNPETEVCEADYACPCDSPSISSENTDSTVLATSAITEHSELTTETDTNTGGTRGSTSPDAETTTDEDISTKVDNITESAITRNTLTTQDITVITTESFNTEGSKVTTEESAFTNGESTTEKRTTEEDLSTKEDDTSESATTTSTYSTTTIDECSYDSNPNYFTCTVKGRFRNANDRTCQTYFLCSILSSGRVIQTKYTCPTNSNFNPKLELCDADYECPCTTSEVTSTTEEVTTQDVTVITTEKHTTGEDLSTTEDDTSESATTTSTSTTAIDECSYNSNPNYFTCTVKGRFRNANDRTCQTYFLCSILSSGRVIQTKYTCPSNSNFNPKLELCDADYECPCTTSEVTSTTEGVTTQDVTVTTTEDSNTEETKVTTEESAFTNEESTTEKRTTEEDLSTKEDDTSESATITSTYSTTTIDECSYDSNPNYFTCTVKGRFRNANDRTCQTYFLCSILSSGRVIQTKYTCPSNSNFNPKLELCDADYECPCTTSEVTSTTEGVTTQDVTVTTTEDSNTEETKVTTEESAFTNEESTTEKRTTEEDLSTKEDDTSESATITSTYSTTTIDECSYDSNPNYFTCTVKGRFRNANDRTCQTYFLCSILSSGRVIQTKYTCPSNSNFNPNLELCDADYECPCTTSEVTSTTEEVTTQDVTVITTEKHTTGEDLSTTEDDTSESATTTSTSTTAIDECSYNSNPNYFTCTVKGRFRNANDRTCQTYFLCSILSSGRVIQTKYTCPSNSNFNPKLELCDADYECPCTTSEVTSTTEGVTTQDVTVTTTEDSNTEETKVTTEESAFTNEESTTEKRTTEEDLSTKEDDTSESATITSTYSTTTIDECSYDSNPNYFTCTVKGRFRNANDRTCQTYFLCSILSSGRVIQTKYTCPSNSNFNPKLELCDADYECPCTTSEVTSTTEGVTTQDVTVTTTEDSNTEETKVTTEESAFTNEESTTEKRTTEEDLSTKEDDTSESATITSTYSTTTIDECSYDSNPNYFTCTVKGRFRNANDRTCQTYFLCSILSSGRVIQTKYTCPSNSNFNPNLELCDADYECPCTTSEVTSTTEEVTTQDVTVITTEKHTTGEDLSTTEDDTSESATTTSTSTTAIDECSYNSNPNYFTCTVKGRFRNANDRTCQTYFLCSILSSGRVIQTKYTCPSNSNFNPKLELCDADYECPCTTSEVTSTTEGVTTQDVTVTTTEDSNTEETKVTTEESAFTNEESTTEKRTTEEDLSTKEDDTSESATITSTYSTTTIDECSYDSNPNYFTCTVKGRFRNANDRTCQTYFLCSILSSGRVIQTKYTCPSDSNFNPKLELCDADYECPCTTSEVTSTTEEVTTQDVTVITTEGSNTDETKVSTEKSTTMNGESTTEKRTTEEDLSTKEDDTNEPATTTSTSTTAIDECSYNSNPNYFTCTVKGRFRNANDRTCQTYFLCNILSSGRVIQTKYTCPTNSNFNPKLQLCDVDYKCPCTTSTATSTTQEVTA